MKTQKEEIIEKLRLYKPDGEMLEIELYQEHEKVGYVQSIRKFDGFFAVYYQKGYIAEFRGFPSVILLKNKQRHN